MLSLNNDFQKVVIKWPQIKNVTKWPLFSDINRTDSYVESDDFLNSVT